MGNYLFNTEVLLQALNGGTNLAGVFRDFGGNVIPALLREQKVYVCDFCNNRIPDSSRGEAPSYWRDLGTVAAYHKADIDLRPVAPGFNLYNESWLNIITENI